MTTDGDWDAFLSPDQWCYHGVDRDSSYTLVSIRFVPHSTLRSLLYSLGGINYNRLKGCSIYVARINKLGHTSMARPCGRCMNLLRSYGVEEIVYTVTRDTWRREWLQ